MGVSTGTFVGYQPTDAPKPVTRPDRATSLPTVYRGRREVRKAPTMARPTRPTKRRTTRHTLPLTLEVIERHTYEVADHELAEQLRQALKAGDTERLDELITYMSIDGPTTSDVLDCGEVNAAKRNGRR